MPCIMTTDRNFNSNFSGKRLYSKKSYNSLKTDKYLSISQSTNQRLPHILVPCSLYKVFFFTFVSSWWKMIFENVFKILQ